MLSLESVRFDCSSVTAGSGKKITWRCARGHEWQAKISNRTAAGSGCPYCANKKVLKGFNDLASRDPNLANEAFGWDPTTFTVGSDKSQIWKCPQGHKWKAAIKTRTREKYRSSCPICSNKRVLVGTNDLATEFPEVAAQAHNWNPNSVASGSHLKKQWVCSRGHIWTTAVRERTYQKSGCPVCANKKVVQGFNDLAFTHPTIAAEAYKWDPTTVTAGSAKKRQWKCNLGHTWSTTIANRISQNQGCPVCANKKVVQGFNDLAFTHPIIAAEAYKWDPTTVTAGSEKKRQWKCSLGHTWSTAVKARATAENGCPFCGGKKVLIGFNDLAFTHPIIAAEAYKWDPTTVTAGSHKLKLWQCEENHVWKAPVLNRTAKDPSGCPTCANKGYDPNAYAWFYFIRNDEKDLYQIGITNLPDQRLKRHKRGGWEFIEIRGPMDGHLTQKLETDCLHALEKRGAILGHKAGIEKFDGYTEAWTKQSLNVTSIKQILEWVYEDEAGQ